MANTRRARHAPAPVTIAHLHPAALAEARRLSGGDMARLRILSPTSVLVLNRGRADPTGIARSPTSKSRP